MDPAVIILSLKMKAVSFVKSLGNGLNIFPKEYSHLYLAIENELAAVICIEDPLREEAAAVVEALRNEGIQKNSHDDRGQ